MTEQSDGEIDRQRHVGCHECGDFEMSKKYRGTRATPGKDKYDAIDLPDECPACGADLVITMTDGGSNMSDGEVGHIVLNLSGEEALRLYADIVHMDEQWEEEEPYSSIREKLKNQIARRQ